MTNPAPRLHQNHFGDSQLWYEVKFPTSGTVSYGTK